MTRFLLCFVLALPALIANSAPKNVLWIYLEDVSGWFSCYGDTTIQTPNIDGLAASGTRFTRFYTPAGVCSATRSENLLNPSSSSSAHWPKRIKRTLGFGSVVGKSVPPCYQADQIYIF